MSAFHGSRTAVSSFVAVLMFALAAPISVNAEDEVRTDEQVLAAEDHDPALAPAAAITVTTQVSSDVRWAPDAGPAWLAASRAAARRAAPAFPAWDAARWSPVEPSQATSPDAIPAALASGQRAESAHLATVPLPGEAAGDGVLAEC
jgi:hypothetical protein